MGVLEAPAPAGEVPILEAPTVEIPAREILTLNVFDYSGPAGTFKTPVGDC